MFFHFCFLVCRAPDPDTVLIMQTSKDVFSAKGLVQNKKQGGSRLISSIRRDDKESPAEDTVTCDPFSAARCRVYRRNTNTKKVLSCIFSTKSAIVH